MKSLVSPRSKAWRCSSTPHEETSGDGGMEPPVVPNGPSLLLKLTLAMTRIGCGKASPPNICGIRSCEIVSLALNDFDLNGTLPVAFFVQMTSLTALEITFSQSLVGSIPSEIGSLSLLDRLYLHYTQLIGSIPSEITSLFQLSSLSLFQNQLTGTIPSGLTPSLNWSICIFKAIDWQELLPLRLDPYHCTHCICTWINWQDQFLLRSAPQLSWVHCIFSIIYWLEPFPLGSVPYLSWSF